MKKNMYSLMLSKSLVEEIDNLAYKQSTNRSNLINHILAEYLSLSTPEMHIKEVFDLLSVRMERLNNFIIQNVSSDSTLFIKSSLDYKYKPTIKYALELYKNRDTCIGSLKIQFRTQSELLISCLNDFFEIWIELEKKYIHSKLPYKNDLYKIEHNKFERVFITPENEFDTQILSRAISDYIQMFDSILKFFLHSPDITFLKIEKEYISYLNNCILVI